MLSVNIDHIATIRNARNSLYPSLSRALELIKEGGAEIVTIHLREDRRHIKDKDVENISNSKILPLNFEMANTKEMVDIALGIKPKFICLVPEKRKEVTTEGGIDVINLSISLKKTIDILTKNGSEVSLFIDPQIKYIDASIKCGAKTIELHTGGFAQMGTLEEFQKLQGAAKYARALGLKVHAGHGLTFESLSQVCSIREIEVFHIGHFLITESIFIGLKEATRQMKVIIDKSK
jgi:pyridoxine 5-phosphate synthase